jgi:hypothetical protein
MVIRGVYERHQVQSLNHGIGFDTAAIELLLPTYGESLGLRGKICKHFALNPHPTLIPAIESGWVQSVHSFGSEVGMDDYIRARPDIFFNGRDGSLRSNRVLCQLAGQYWPASVARRTWDMTPMGVVIRHLRGSTSKRTRARTLAAENLSSRPWRPSLKVEFLPSSKRWMRWNSARKPACPSRPS